MGEDPLGRDRPACAYVARERDRRLDLAVRKGRRAAVMARIDDLDPDRGRVHVVFAFPRPPARVPGTVALGDQLVDGAVLPNQIMRRDLGSGIGKRLQCGFTRRHARIVQDEAIGPAIAAPLAMVGRGHEASNERAVRGRTCGHVPRPAPRAERRRAAPWRRAKAMARVAWIDQYQARQ